MQDIRRMLPVKQICHLIAEVIAETNTGFENKVSSIRHIETSAFTMD